MTARKTAVTCASAAALAIACSSVKLSEGYAPTVVPDKLAGGLPTGGYGETQGVKLGETRSEKYWSDRLAKRLADDYDAEIGQCIHVDLPDSARATAISLSYNAGAPALCRSAIVRLWNAGDFEGGCRAILTKGKDGQYNGWRIASRPKGPGTPAVIQRGLINRRAKERRECLAGLNEPPVIAPAPASAPVIVPVPAPAAPAVAEAPKVSWWRSLLNRAWCWIFKCEAGK